MSFEKLQKNCIHKKKCAFDFLIIITPKNCFNKISVLFG